MLIFEFENGSIVNLLTMEALLSENGRYFLVCQSGNRYELTEEEYEVLIQELQNLKNEYKNKMKLFDEIEIEYKKELDKLINK